MEQNFSVGNLKRIWALQTRRGDERLLNFYPSVRVAFDDRRTARRTLQDVRSGRLASLVSEAELEELARTALQASEVARDNALFETSQDLMDSVQRDAFSWGLVKAGTHEGRDIFALGGGAEIYFADKILQQAVTQISPQRSSSRQDIVAGLSRTLDSRLPKTVIRTDVEKFYESVDHALVLQGIESADMSPTFQGLIRGLLREMSDLTGKQRGLPTGVGLSAKLAEFFLAGLDSALIAAPRVLFYARYVDDIVVVLGETEHGALDASREFDKIRDQLTARKLTLSTSKTLVRRTDDKYRFNQFDFLGYRFEGTPTLVVSLTDARRDQIKARVDSSFDRWAAGSVSDQGNRRLLLDRLRYITGNFRLTNNKRNAMIGFYFSNPHLRDRDLIDELDAHLVHRASSSALPIELATKVSELTFADGYDERRLHRFPPQQLRRIRRAWNG